MQKVKNKFILTGLFILVMYAAASAQKVRFNSMGMALAEFINSEKVINHFTYGDDNPKDSFIVFVDLNNILSGCQINKWKGFNVKIVKDGALVDSLKLFNAHFLLKGRCNYYVLMSRKESTKNTVIALMHACSNIVSSVRITEKDRLYYLNKIENGVW